MKDLSMNTKIHLKLLTWLCFDVTEPLNSEDYRGREPLANPDMRTDSSEYRPKPPNGPK